MRDAGRQKALSRTNISEVVITAEFAARIADQVGDVGIVIELQRTQLAIPPA